MSNPLALDVSASSEEAAVPHDTAEVLTFSPLASSLGSSVPPSPLSGGMSGRMGGGPSPMMLSPKGGAPRTTGKQSIKGHQVPSSSGSDWDSSGDEEGGGGTARTAGGANDSSFDY
mmetsp:Transcript_10567/g.27085  ORF Transcript_10567/g.27085 Transcript_10567/m.27085 type:complete len:116 (-) Transcript_10567:36-383(-)